MYKSSRDRVEAWPVGGTKAKLAVLAKRNGKSLAATVSEILEEAVKDIKTPKRLNPEEGS